MLGIGRKNTAEEPAILSDDEGASPRKGKRTLLLALLGGAGIAALLTLGNDKTDAPPRSEPEPVATDTAEATKPRNPNAGKYMPLVLYVDGALNPHVGLVNNDLKAAERAKSQCLKSAHAEACMPIANLTREDPGCIAYARDTEQAGKYHLNIFHRAEDNTAFTDGAPTVPRYFCNDPILEREIQDGKTVSAPRPVPNTTEVFTDQIRVLKQDVYLMRSDGTSRGGPMIVEGSCVEISSGGWNETGVASTSYLVTAWQKNGNGNNRTGYVERSQTRAALQGEYTPQTCTAVFGPNAPG